MQIGVMNSPRESVYEEAAAFGRADFDFIDLTIEGPQTGERARLEGELLQSPMFGEDNRLTNINPAGGMAQAIQNENPDVDLSADTVTVYRATIGDQLRFNDFVALNRPQRRVGIEPPCLVRKNRRSAPMEGVDRKPVPGPMHEGRADQ